jgi:hypothetical protein
MSGQARVTSVEALDSFRSSLIVYLSQAKPALDEVAADVMRMRVWLENEQRSSWEGQLRRRLKDLEEAQQALFSARIGALRQDTAIPQLQVQKAKRSVEEAESKLRMIKKWSRDFDNRVQPLLKQVEKLQTVLSQDMGEALIYLGEAIRTLAAYAERTAAPSLPASPAGAGSSVTEHNPGTAAGGGASS